MTDSVEDSVLVELMAENLANRGAGMTVFVLVAVMVVQLEVLMVDEWVLRKV